ncbi:unnamed protein product [Cunninghamella blakesleeana]
MLIKKGLAIITLFTSLVYSCEIDCRHGVANALAEEYKPVVMDTVDKLQLILKRNLFHNDNIPSIISDAVPVESIHENIILTTQDTLKKFTAEITKKQLEEGIFSVMFKEEKPFKGDCNNPKRLERKMPPVGESWTMEECNKMDYICGNPPSICYHLQMVKSRIIERIENQLTDHATFDNGLLVHSLVQNIKRSLHSVMVHFGAGSLVDNIETINYADSLVSSTIRSLDIWAKEDLSTVCKGPNASKYCTGWDERVKIEILKWP